MSMPCPVFDAHLHIIDPRFPISRNQGFLPEPYTVEAYRLQMAELSSIVTACGGAVVSGSFQGFDQSYLLDALEHLGPDYVGVTQIPFDYPEAGITSLHRQGVRAIRFNLRRGGSESIAYLEELALKVSDLVGWHSEFYLDSADLAKEGLVERLLTLPQIVVDHMGLSRGGMPDLLKLVEKGAMVKATGLHRGDLDWLESMKQIHAVNPGALMFGTDLPSTRAPVPFQRSDLERILESFPESDLELILSRNALSLYRRAVQS